MKLGPKGDDVRSARSSSESTKDSPDELSNLDCCRSDASLDHRVGEAKLAKRRDCIWRQQEAKAQFARVYCTFENRDVPTRSLKGQAGRKAANAGADNEATLQDQENPTPRPFGPWDQGPFGP